MHKDKFVFAQLVEFLDRNHFNYLVRKYLGDKYIKFFSCWNQLLVMMFGQLAKCESLRDLIVALEAHWRKLYHLGMGKSVTRSNLAKANEQRDYRIFEDFAYHLVAEARSKSTEKIFGFDGHVYAFDSTTIDICLEVFEKVGTGTEDIINKCREYGLKTLEFYQEEDFRVVIWRTDEGEIVPGRTRGVPEVCQSVPEQLMALIKANPSISRDELSKQLNISVRQVRKVINQFRNDGVLTREGGDSGRWIINRT